MKIPNLKYLIAQSKHVNQALQKNSAYEHLNPGLVLTSFLYWKTLLQCLDEIYSNKYRLFKNFFFILSLVVFYSNSFGRQVFAVLFLPNNQHGFTDQMWVLCSIFVMWVLFIYVNIKPAFNQETDVLTNAVFSLKVRRPLQFW